MARAHPTDDWHDPREQQDSGDWQALRADLVELLDQVEGHVTQKRARGGGLRANNRRTPARHYPDDESELPGRRRAALQSVTRALERFDERDDDSDVASAIEQIRGRHGRISNRAPAHPDDFSDVVSGMSDRLDRLGGTLRNGGQSQANIQDVADQISQLTGTVELLARQAPQGDHPDIARRLDGLAGNIEQLTNMQQHYSDGPRSQIEELSATHERNFHSIENGVRNVYDRIDSIEQNLALNPADIERLTQEMGAISQEMANVTQVMKAGGGGTSHTLLTRIDALNARVGQIEDRGDGSAVGGLRADIETLRNTVRDATEPHFSALKSQIDGLGQKFSSAGGSDISAGQLETQIRQLIARMDQTGEQLSDVTRLYMDNAERGGGPDFEALAEMIAQRTSEVVSNTSAKNPGLNDASLDALETRMARLFEGSGDGVNSGDFASVQEGIRQVGAQLARLEASLDGNSSLPADPHLEIPTPTAPPATQPKSRVASAPPATPAATKKPAPRSDAMQTNPLDEAPLFDQGFDAAPEHAASAQPQVAKKTPAKNTSRQRPAEKTVPKQPAKGKNTAYDTGAAERPAKPRSSFVDDTDVKFDTEQPQHSEEPEFSTKSDPATASRNTFIEAARRAAQRQKNDKDAEPQSLIARAFARFQGKKADPEPAQKSTPDTRKPAQSKRAHAHAEKLARAKLRAQAQDNSAFIKDAEANHLPYGMEADLAADAREIDDTPQESMLSRHRRPILLVASIVTISFLSLNLIEKRLNAGMESTSEVAQNALMQDATPALPLQMTPSASNSPTQQQTVMLDPAPTGSVDPFVRVAPDGPTAQLNQSLPIALSDAADAMKNVDDTDFATSSIAPVETVAEPDLSVVGFKLELPSESIGPLALRQAAADGNPHAQFEVAAIYSEGQALDQDHTSAAKWYERAAAQGFVPAEYRLGNLYEHGKGVDKDLTQAKLWYQRAAEAGNRMSMHNLAALYASGELGTQEFSLAAEWFERAASRGLTDSQFNLGMLYARGLGVPQNMSASYKWFSLAAIQGDDGAVKARDDVARSLDPDTMSRLQVEITNWKRASIDITANFAPIGTWAEDFNPGQTIRDKSVVEKVQAALNRLGYDVGVPDGLMGPRTRDAIRDFERATGMSESGAINPRLLAVLGSQPV